MAPSHQSRDRVAGGYQQAFSAGMGQLEGNFGTPEQVEGGKRVTLGNKHWDKTAGGQHLAVEAAVSVCFVVMFVICCHCVVSPLLFSAKLTLSLLPIHQERL